MKNLRGKNAIVTGASRGLGVYIAKALAAEGVNVALSARSADALEETRRSCESKSVRAIAIPADVSSPDEQRRLLAEAERELGPIDILVNNAGIEITERHELLSTAQIDALLTTNLNAPIWFTKLILPSMMDRRTGAIVNVASLAGKGPVPFNAIYGASKAGLVGFTESMVGELRGTGVHIAVVCPGFVSDAGMWADHTAATGVEAPRLAKAVVPEKVAAAVIAAIRGKTEVLVASGPMRPLLALGQLFPGVKTFFIERSGVTKIFRDEADRLRQGDDRPARQREDAGVH